jgi:DNA modification methylase
VSLPIDQLVFDPNNVRKHSNKNLDAIKGSLTKFGQQKPIVIDEKNIILAGNGTVMAAKALGWSEIQCVQTDLKDSHLKTAFAIADNRTAELAEWDDDLLKETLASLQLNDFDIESIGFDAKEFEIETGNPGNTDPDDVPEVPQNVRGVKTGDLWILGDHRLLCGDSTKREDVERLMNGEKADMVFTDPPYGMNLDTDYSSMIASSGNAGTKYKGPIIGDDREFNPVFYFDLFKNVSEQFWFGADYYAKHLPANGAWIVWDKNSGHDGTHIGVIDGIIGSAFELCWSKSKHQRLIARIGGLRCGAAKMMNEIRVHPTQKPITLIEWFFNRWGKTADLVVDLFLGSGSTLIACEKTGRKCYGMEIDPHYCSVIIERWEKFSGKKAILEQTEVKDGQKTSSSDGT